MHLLWEPDPPDHGCDPTLADPSTRQLLQRGTVKLGFTNLDMPFKSLHCQIKALQLLIFLFSVFFLVNFFHSLV